MLKSIINLPQTALDFVHKVWVELKLMEWLTLGETVRATSLVIGLTALFVLILTGMDTVFTTLRTFLFNNF